MQLLKIDLVKAFKQNYLSVLFVITFIFLILNDCFGLTSLSTVDEVFGILLFLILLFLIFNNNNKMFVYLIIIFSFLTAVGFISSLANFEHIGFYNMFIGAFLFIKPYIYFFVALFLPKEKTMNFKPLIYISKIMICIMFISFLVFLIDHSYFSNDNHTAFTFFTTFGGSIANWLLIFLAIISLKYSKFNFVFALMAVAMVIASDSGLGQLGLLLAFYFLFIKRKIKMNILILLAVGILLFILSYDEIMDYLLDLDAPRSLFFQYSFVTALSYFPFGSGFATFASPLAGQDYSYLYYLYGFDSRYGMGPNSSPSFLYDSYFPMIIGETGLFGTALYIIFIIITFCLIYKIPKTRYKDSALLLFVYFLVSSLGFYSGSSMACANFLILGLLLQSINNQNYCLKLEFNYK